ncbi:hypothetical protein Tco_1134865 [Tanacetum coccineum]
MDQRVRSQLIGKDLVSGLLVYELPLSSLRKKYRLSLKNDMPPRDKKLQEEGTNGGETGTVNEQNIELTMDHVDNTFSRLDHEDANEHIEKVLEIFDLFHIPNITQDQVMLRAFPMSLTGAASRWLRSKPSGSITTWEDLKIKFLSKYCPPARTTKKIEEINNFQQKSDETLYQVWERFKELLMKCPQHYLTEMQEVILFYNGLDVQTRQILNSKGAIPSKTAADAKKVNEKVYAAQVGCEQCKGPHYTKDCPLKEESKTLKEVTTLKLVDLSKEEDIGQQL